jgi:voltage-gated potassium channel
MKYFAALLYFLQNKATKKNLTILFKFFLFLAFLISIYSVLFHMLMLYEGRNFSWMTGLYWTFTVMSTLGFGDITFHTDLGKFYTILVLMSGIVFLLIILPFTFVQFFYSPWLEAQKKAQTPRELPEETSGHVILTNFDPITANLVEKLQRYQYHYVILTDDLAKSQELLDQGYNVVVGDLDAPETYNRLRLKNAALVVVTNDDMTNTSISFTIREITDKVPIVTNADNEHSIDILEFTGNTQVFQFMKMLGKALARRALGVHMGMNIVGTFDELLIAEVPAKETSLEGKTLVETRLRERTGITVVGLWDRGRFTLPLPDTAISSSSVLMLAGSSEHLKKYEHLYCISCAKYSADAPILILGGGRVGHAAAEALEEHHIDYTIVEKHTSVIKNIRGNYIHGDAADITTLHRAGILEARSVIITTHNDAMNIYLTFYCRQLRSDIQIISRATEERTVRKLHRAGADLVMSYASMGANSILNILQPNEISMFTEGLNIFTRPIKASLVGKSLIESGIRPKTGCSVIAINTPEKQIVNPDPRTQLGEHDELILIGTTEAEKKFMESY